MKAVDLSSRARQLLKVLVECYIADGDPIGSKTLAACSGVRVSSATVRNVMVELEKLGLVSSPHTSAGRVPTLHAFRYFVDHLLEPKPINADWQEQVRQCFGDCQNERELIRAVAQVLAELTHAAGLVTVNARASARIRKIEFLPQSNDHVLVLLVLADAQVSHGVVTVERAVSAAELLAAEQWAQRHWAAQPIVDVMAEWEAGSALDEGGEREPAAVLAMSLLSSFLMAFRREQDFVVKGQANLISQIEGEDLVHLERLYRVLDARQAIIPQFQTTADGEAVRVLLGEEAWQAGETFSLITSSYGDVDAAGGSLALLGPLRMPYAQLVPFVGWVAKILGAALNTP